jgi:hypothetical protein
MSLQALMALVGHVTPQMTLRYATLASPTLRAAYGEAMGKMRRPFTLTPVGKPILPDKVGWLHSEMLKPLVAQGYYARRCLPVCQHLRDLRQLHHRTRIPGCPHRPTRRRPSTHSRRPEPRLDRRGCRHDRVAHALTDHLHRLDR